PEEGDRIGDPSVAWPETRKTLQVGVIEITAVVPDSETAQRALLFLPGFVPAGIEPADPMIQVRTDVYGISFDRRTR
ncbi:MAG TPA: catalase, partial [Armatimonadota bacterium]|nr:catalase [Armatimonadota bacterium]